MQKLLKPLELVEEEVEGSELTTPASEVIDMTTKKRNSKCGKLHKTETPHS
jgi:hypothetical protein